MVEISNLERTCLECLRQGKSQKETATLILFSETKVERIYKELRDRFNCENNYQLLSFAYENNLLTQMKELPHSEQNE